LSDGQTDGQTTASLNAPLWWREHKKSRAIVT